MDKLLTKEDVAAYLIKLNSACQVLKNPVRRVRRVRRERSSNTVDCYTKACNAEIKFSESSSGTKYLLVTLDGSTEVVGHYTPKGEEFLDVAVQVNYEDFNILSVDRGTHPALAVAMANLLNTIKFLVELDIVETVQKQMAEIDKVLGEK